MEGHSQTVISHQAGAGGDTTVLRERAAAEAGATDDASEDVSKDANIGTGRRKGQGLPPGSVGKGHDAPQTPAT